MIQQGKIVADSIREHNGRIFGDRPLIQNEFTYVLISHQELDMLIARVMHVIELDSDKEHREALKGELKSRIRSWLDNEYREAGYENYDYVEGARIIDISNTKGIIYKK